MSKMPHCLVRGFDSLPRLLVGPTIAGAKWADYLVAPQDSESR